jgi:hypothetical protein
MSDSAKNISIYSLDWIDVTSESFIDSNEKKIEFVKIRVLKDRWNEVKVQYITLSPKKYIDLITVLFSKLPK